MDEGSDIHLSLTGVTDPSNADTSAGFTYAFNCDDGSGYGAFGSSNTATCPTSDDGTRHVGGKVRDKDGGVSTYTADVTVNNVAPSVDAGGDATIDEGGSISRSGSFTDPGTDTWTATVNYGDGSGTNPLTLVGKTFSLSHT